MARRNETRRSSCWAIDLGDQLGVEFRLADFDDVQVHFDLVNTVSFLRSVSMSAPFLPMITPGRAV
jgi:hypothetical protein